MLYVMQKNQNGAMILSHCECGCSEARRQYECEQEARRPRSSVHLELDFKTAEGLRTLHLDFYFINRFCSFFQSIARQKLPLALNQRVNQLLNSLRTLQNRLSPLPPRFSRFGYGPSLCTFLFGRPCTKLGTEARFYQSFTMYGFNLQHQMWGEQKGRRKRLMCMCVGGGMHQGFHTERGPAKELKKNKTNNKQNVYHSYFLKVKNSMHMYYETTFISIHMHGVCVCV